MTKDEKIALVADQLRPLWPLLDCDYNWIAGDLVSEEGEPARFGWWMYRLKPIEGENRDVWMSRSHCLSMSFIILAVPDGVDWRDLCFERPPVEGGDEPR